MRHGSTGSATSPGTPDDITIDGVTSTDLDALHALNEGAVPHVNSLPRATMSWFARQARYFRVAHVRNEIAGFLIGLTPETDYASPNFRWFRERYPRFVYIDRVVVGPSARRRGVARLLYADLAAFASPIAPCLTCEVNTRPDNPGSMAFHRRLGFHQVGAHETEEGAKSVALLIRELR